MLPVIRTTTYLTVINAVRSKLNINQVRNLTVIPLASTLNILQAHDQCHLSFRYKSKNKKLQKQEETESEHVDSNEDEIPDKNSKIMNVRAGSLRTDVLLKAGLGIARNKIENLFYESKIRVNGEKIFKKSVEVNVGDEIDVIKGVSITNPKFLVVARVEVLSTKGGEDGLSVKLRRCKALTIENYKQHPWKREVTE